MLGPTDLTRENKMAFIKEATRAKDRITFLKHEYEQSSRELNECVPSLVPFVSCLLIEGSQVQSHERVYFASQRRSSCQTFDDHA